MSPDLGTRLWAALGERHVLADPDLRAPYETDWTGRFHGTASLVARPGTADEVAEVVCACRDAGAAIVTQGGNTGLVGGSVPRGSEVVLSTRRLDTVGDVDPATRQVTVGAGATLAAVADRAREHGLDVGVDLAARDSATIGGMVATNAGGIRVVRHGMMRARVVGVEAVLADGALVGRLHGLEKDNTGYNLAQLLTGSEGTLGILTRVRLRLVPHLPARVVALIGLADLAAAVALLPRLRAHVPALDAVEFIDEATVALVREHAGLPAPLGRDVPVHLLVEVADRDDPTDQLAAVVSDLDDVAVGVDAGDRARLWAYREGATEAVNAAGVPRKLDVTVPVDAVPAFADAVRETVAELAPRARVALYGHLADGNVHVNLLDAGDRGEQLDEAILTRVAAHDGSISAEHGIGVAKVGWLHLSRTPAEIAAMRAIKRALDPDGLLNPGALLPAGDTRR